MLGNFLKILTIVGSCGQTLGGASGTPWVGDVEQASLPANSEPLYINAFSIPQSPQGGSPLLHVVRIDQNVHMRIGAPHNRDGPNIAQLLPFLDGYLTYSPNVLCDVGDSLTFYIELDQIYYQSDNSYICAGYTKALYTSYSDMYSLTFSAVTLSHTPPYSPPYGTLQEDPHLRFANGAVADFRGINNTIFNILSHPNISFSMKTMDVSFLLPKPVKVDGSFFTEAFFLIKEISTTFLISIHASKPGLEYYNLNTPLQKVKKYKSFGYEKIYCNIQSGSYEISTPNWNITIVRRPIYNSLTNNMNWRLDTKIKLKSKYGIKNVHGIIGQTFQKNRIFTTGKRDDYSGKTYVKTSAQAEGVIDGVFTDYIMKDIASHRYKYSMFEENDEDKSTKNDKVFASSEELLLKEFE